MIDRQARSRLRNYAEQIGAFGLLGWIRFKFDRLRARRASEGDLFTVRTRFARHPILVRANTSDISVFAQVFIHREYRPLDDCADGGLIVDCGANVGYSSAYLLSRFPRADLIAIEPHADNFRLLTRNLAPYGGRARALQAAVWSSSRGLIVSEAAAGARKEWAVTVREPGLDEDPTVVSVDLGSVLDQSGHDRIAILKVDIEGSEAEVFARSTEPWLGRVDNIAIELHGDHCQEVVSRALRDRGFDAETNEELTIFRRATIRTASDRRR